MSPIEFHPQAVDEIEATYDYLFEHADADIAEAFREEVERKLAHCHNNPPIYRIRRYQVRRANLERFSEHYIAYMLWESRFVVALGHAKRRPFYWYRRPKNFRDSR